MEPSLEMLPNELLVWVCEHLSSDDFMGSLVALARTNKRTYQAASVVLCRTIKFYIPKSKRECESLGQNVNLCRKALHRDGNVAQVRRLILEDLSPRPSGAQSLLSPWNSDRKKNNDPPGRRGVWRRPKIPIVEREDDETKWGLVDWLNDDYDAQSTSLHTHSGLSEKYTDLAFGPIVSLVEVLPGLTDFVYSCIGQLPPLVLIALHDHHPRIRLCIQHLFLSSPTVGDLMMNPYERMLATSPCLYDVRCAEKLYDRSCFMDSLVRLAPNLKEVDFGTARGNTPRLHPNKPKCTLRCLHIREFWRNSLQDTIEAWSSQTDFSVLETLVLVGSVTKESVVFLQTCDFRSLKTLAIRHDESEYFQDAASFISSLPNLTTLRMQGYFPYTGLSAALGSNLHILDLCRMGNHNDGHPVPLGTPHIAEIAASYPVLEDLSLTVRRSLGDETEVAAYKELGALPKVRKLAIGLAVDVFPETYSKPKKKALRPRSLELSHFSRQQVRDMFVNIAIDERLATSIFNVISRAKVSSHSVPLEELNLDVWGLGAFQDEYHHAFCYPKAMSGPWRIRPNARDDRRDDVVAKKLYCAPTPDELFWTQRIETSPYYEVFRELWPLQKTVHGRKVKGSWKKEWHSLLLSVDA